MKATLSLAAILLAAGIPTVNAQTELAIANQPAPTDTALKQKKILKIEAEIAALQAELAALRGETASVNDLISEPVPIIPEAAAIIGGTEHSYTVQPGDGLMKIARKTNCKASDIAAVNNMAMTDIIRPGQILKLPTGATTVAAAPKASVVEEAPKPKAQPATQPKPKTYKIKEGETYYSISRRMKIPLNDLMTANPKAPANRLYTGRVINLPMKGEVPAPVPAPAPTPAAADTTPAPAPAPTPAAADTTPETASTAEPVSDTPPAPAPAPAEEPRKKIVAVSVDEEISYGDFASKYGTDTDRLNSLNDLSLTSATILAKGSELYVPAKTTASN